jgi:phage terminase large subunit-like protein
LDEVPPLTRVVIGVDPPGSMGTECGIVAAGTAKIDGVQHGYILLDYSLKALPDAWAGEVLRAYNFCGADRIVGEANYGGNMVQNTIEQAARSRNMSVSYKDVQATRGKAVRAEPVVALFEQGRCHIVGELALLEEEMCNWIPGETKDSPNRVDSAVWCIYELMITGKDPNIRWL